MTYILFFSAIIAGVLCKKSKAVSAYILIVILILSVYKYNCADLNNYRGEYNNIMSGIGSSKYIGQYWLTRFCTSMKLSFNQYLYVYYCLFFLILIGAIAKLTANVNVVLSCYMIYSFGIDAIQMKTMLADGVTLIALVFLFNAKKKCVLENKKNNKYFYLFLLFSIIAISIHFINAFFMVVGLYFYFVGYQKYKKYIFVFVSITFVLLYLNILPKIVTFIAQHLSLLDIEYITYWMMRRAQWGWIIPTAALGLITIYIESINKYALTYKGRKDNEITEYARKFIYSIWAIMPLFLYNATFVRVVRVYVVLVSILYSRCEGIRLKMKKRELGVYLLFFSIIIYLYMYEIQPYYDSTLGAILRYNTLFE